MMSLGWLRVVFVPVSRCVSFLQFSPNSRYHFQMEERQVAINSENILQSGNDEKVKQTEKKRSDEVEENSNNANKDVSTRDKTRTRDHSDRDHLTEAVIASLLYG